MAANTPQNTVSANEADTVAATLRSSRWRAALGFPPAS